MKVKAARKYKKWCKMNNWEALKAEHDHLFDQMQVQ